MSCLSLIDVAELSVRELALQIAEQFRAFGVSIGLKAAVCIGGMDMVPQAAELSARPHVLSNGLGSS